MKTRLILGSMMAALLLGGTVISADMDLIGQLQPHQPARFKAVDMAEALEARKANELQLKKLAEALA